MLGTLASYESQNTKAGDFSLGSPVMLQPRQVSSTEPSHALSRTGASEPRPNRCGPEPCSAASGRPSVRSVLLNTVHLRTRTGCLSYGPAESPAPLSPLRRDALRGPSSPGSRQARRLSIGFCVGVGSVQSGSDVPPASLPLLIVGRTSVPETQGPAVIS